MRRDERGNALVVLGVIAVVLFVLVGVATAIYSKAHTETRTCTVAGKEYVYTGSGKSMSREARVYTDECGTLTVHDSLFDGAFESADTYGRLDEGHAYRMKLRGLRVGVFSMFPNIVEAEEVSQ